MGIFKGQELHLTPINGVISLKPTLNYLDKSDKTAKMEGRPKLNEQSSDDESAMEESGEASVQKIGVKFVKDTTERSLEMKKKSFEYQQKMAEEEPWTYLKYHHVKSQKWLDETQNLFCQKLDEVAFSGDVKVEDYISDLRTG